jgi:WD40 repeat protein
MMRIYSADVEAQHQLDDEQLLRGGQDDYPRDVQHSIEGLHSSSITCIRWIPGTQTLITGSGSGIVQRFSAAGAQEWSSPVGSGGALSIAVHPGIASGQPYIAVGSMGGQVSVIDARTGDLLASTAAHSKYVVRVLWSADGQLLSCSWDQSVAIHRVQKQVAAGGVGLQEVAKVGPWIDSETVWWA